MNMGNHWPRVGCLLEINNRSAGAVLRKIQLDQPCRPRTAGEYKGGQVQYAGFAGEGCRVERGGVDVQRQVLGVHSSERRSGDRAEHVDDSYAAEIWSLKEGAILQADTGSTRRSRPPGNLQAKGA